jgi:hypothetical protein
MTNDRVYCLFLTKNEDLNITLYEEIPVADPVAGPAVLL